MERRKEKGRKEERRKLKGITVNCNSKIHNNYNAKKDNKIITTGNHSA